MTRCSLSILALTTRWLAPVLVALFVAFQPGTAQAQTAAAAGLPDMQPWPWPFPGQPSSTSGRPLDRTQNVLILGTDRRPDTPDWRTDVIVVTAVDWDKHQVGMLSIPRDLYLPIPGNQENRINTADYVGEVEQYPGGGPALVEATLSDNMGIKTDNWIRVNYLDFERFIDTLGGIDITLDAPFHEHAPEKDSPVGWVDFSLDAGPQHLNGHDTLQYVRARYLSSDLSRNARQQQVLWALRNRLSDMGWLTRLPELWSAYQGMFQTNLSAWDVIRFSWLATTTQRAQVHDRTFGFDLMVPYTTPGGAMVLLMADRGRIDAFVDGLFDAPSPN